MSIAGWVGRSTRFAGGSVDFDNNKTNLPMGQPVDISPPHSAEPLHMSIEAVGLLFKSWRWVRGVCIEIAVVGSGCGYKNCRHCGSINHRYYYVVLLAVRPWFMIPVC